MKMQQKSSLTGKRAAAVMCALLLLMGQQQVCARPMASQAQSGSEQRADVNVQQPVPALRRSARMTPLWRIMSSKPSGAFCQNNFECSTGFCRAGHCATNQRSEAVKY
ncbi:liver-expressed antimicrobial peptide 2 isoform X1 [Oryzias latipes]|uniref:liver-expressed antimicrobial peptide 2 isoform X1 n=1 Tax=Oryzias latipes TaxID=8090 RepID=UPI0005CC1D2F|nr:liver-expressed antimicrobial peptide 2 isoform X1 [Oryzias latipes]